MAFLLTHSLELRKDASNVKHDDTIGEHLIEVDAKCAPIGMANMRKININKIASSQLRGMFAQSVSID